MIDDCNTIYVSDLLEISSMDLYSLDTEYLSCAVQVLDSELSKDDLGFSYEDLMDTSSLIMCELEKRGVEISISDD